MSTNTSLTIIFAVLIIGLTVGIMGVQFTDSQRTVHYAAPR